MIDELRLKNALRCQSSHGQKCCENCPYDLHDGTCDIWNISKDALEYMANVEKLLNTLQDILPTLVYKLKEDLKNART